MYQIFIYLIEFLQSCTLKSSEFYFVELSFRMYLGISETAIFLYHVLKFSKVIINSFLFLLFWDWRLYSDKRFISHLRRKTCSSEHLFGLHAEVELCFKLFQTSCREDKATHAEGSGPSDDLVEIWLMVLNAIIDAEKIIGRKINGAVKELLLRPEVFSLKELISHNLYFYQ